MIQTLEDDRIFLNYGPIQMSLDISDGNRKMPELALIVSEFIIQTFNELTCCLVEIKENKYNTQQIEHYPRVLQKMINAVKIIGDESLTPLAAVAGTMAEIALEKALALGAERVIINNGGDLAFKDVNGGVIKIGIPINERLADRKIIITVTGDQNISGVCTSGIGGRSFTRGIATCAVAMASTSSVADACATYLGNKTDVEDDNIVRCNAEEIDSDTDIPGQLVTIKVGILSKKKKYMALLNGLNSAEDLYKKNIIKGAVLCVQDEIVTIPDGIALLK